MQNWALNKMIDTSRRHFFECIFLDETVFWFRFKWSVFLIQLKVHQHLFEVWLFDWLPAGTGKWFWIKSEKLSSSGFDPERCLRHQDWMSALKLIELSGPSQKFDSVARSYDDRAFRSFANISCFSGIILYHCRNGFTPGSGDIHITFVV